jgi:ABC-type branched-subunit amino acid transport system ATPase component
VAAADSAPLVLTATGMTVRYDGVTALEDAEITLYGGQVHALVGPNGSGKSTLLRVLAGAVDAGTIELDGRPLPAGVRGRVLAGVVRTPQHTAVMPRLVADRQVGVGARGGSHQTAAVVRHLLAAPSTRTGTHEAAVARALADTGLEHLLGVDPERLATGDQRLLQLARVVATGARVLLVDEPAAGMTVDERTRLAAVLRRLAGNGKAVLLVEHDMRLVGEVADRVTVLDVGRVLASGPVDVVRADPEVHRAYLGAGLPGSEVRA